MNWKWIILIIIIIIIILIVIGLAQNQSKKKTVVLGKNKPTTDDKKIKVETPKNIGLNISHSHVSAGWDLVPGAEYYTVYYSTEPFEGTKTDKVFGPLKNNVFELGCIPNGDYYVKVTASKREGNTVVESEPSPMEKITIDKCKLPNAPKNLSAEEVDDKTVLKWGAVVGADYYMISILTASGTADPPVEVIRINDPMKTSLELTLQRDKVWQLVVSSGSNNCEGLSNSLPLTIRPNRDLDNSSPEDPI